MFYRLQKALPAVKNTKEKTQSNQRCYTWNPTYPGYPAIIILIAGQGRRDRGRERSNFPRTGRACTATSNARNCSALPARTKRETWRRLGARGRAPACPLPRHPVRPRTGPGAVRAQRRPAVRAAGARAAPKRGGMGVAFRRRVDSGRCATVSGAGHRHVRCQADVNASAVGV